MKIFGKKHLEFLMEYFLKIDEQIDGERKTLEFKVYFKDGSSVDSDKPDVIDDNKLVEKIDFNFASYLDRIYVDVKVRETGGYFSVKGESKDWVDAKFTQLKEIINSVPNQNKWLGNFTSQLLIGYVTPFPLALVIGKYVLVPATSNSIATLFITLGLSIAMASILIRILGKMYTEIEFDTTDTHLNPNKKRKRAIKYIVGTFLFPIVLGFYFEFF
ncbi:hypothetical protein [Planococcus sp. NCCP-2050]|uniref:hypothetical protein n=1 Tax=Planococcus sp. NCCP-2050 TaxID=2944679 RepID=UPI00203E99AB|nr:hypothetical protein [Planococcus sp. NCCP-2050]